MPRNKYHDTPVVEFHEVFDHPVAWTPGVPDEAVRKLRCELLFEEVIEFIEASGFKVVCAGADIASDSREMVTYGKPNLIEVADALADIRYVTDGASLVWGIPLEKCLREVHRSNMSKLGEDGKPILREDGKILKGPHFTLPQIEHILNLYKGIQNGGAAS